MTSQRDTDRLIRAFLAEGQTDLPDQLYDVVRREIDRTNQRVVIGPGRMPFMNNIVRIALAATAVVVVAFIGYQFLAAPNVGGPGPAPSQAESPTVAPTSTPSPTPVDAFPVEGALEIGRHSVTVDGVQFSLDLATAGWASDGSYTIYKGGDAPVADFIIWPDSPDNVYADPCAQTWLSPSAGPLAADLAAAVSTVPGTVLVSGPWVVTVGGRAAQRVELTIPEDVGCAAEVFTLWGNEQTGGRHPTELGNTIRVLIIDVDGVRIWIDGETFTRAGPDDIAEVQQIIDSIQFE